MTYTKTICLTLKIRGDYTTKIDQIKRMENIPVNTLVTATYDFVTDTTVCVCLYDQKVEREGE